MRSIRICGVSKSFNGELVLSGIDLTIPSGSFFALLGPSGSGKTTLLRIIGGFETVDEGRVFLGNQDITQLPINERRINTVFQQYALFPHMNVFENVAYALRVRKIEADIIKQKVHSVLTKVHLAKQMYKEINQLSGGQQQRVALARSIINEPEVLLLDEPLAALDSKLREQVLVELIELQDELKTTFVYVTHDQFEALTVADQMAIMNEQGVVEQIGTPKEIYEFPVSRFVAKFVGTTNIFSGKLSIGEGKQKIDVAGLGLFSITISKRSWEVDGAQVYMSVRPEKFEISKVPLQGFSNELTGIVESIVYYGRSTQYHVRLKNGMSIKVFEQNEEHFPQEVIDYDDQVYVYWQKNNMVLFEQ